MCAQTIQKNKKLKAFKNFKKKKKILKTARHFFNKIYIDLNEVIIKSNALMNLILKIIF